MIDTWKLHTKFKDYWSEYEKKDISHVCGVLVKLEHLSSKKDPITTVKDNWGRVCNFLIKWEGK